MTKRNWGFINKSRHSCLLGFITLCFFMVAFIGGCSDSGGKSKTAYSLTGYDGYDLNAGNSNLKFFSEFPWFVNATFQVFDEQGNGVSGLGVGKFQALENGNAVSADESELRVLQRTGLPSDYTYSLKTVLLIDNTPSSVNNLEKMLDAAQVVVDNMDTERQQEVAIVAYDQAGDPYVVQDFTKSQSVLNTALSPNADNAIEVSSGTTNFYGAVIFSLSLWEDNPSPENKDFVQGVLVAITDGKDTTNLYSVADAIAARDDKQIITVAVGDDIPQGDLENLEKLGNAGYYPVPEPDREPDAKFDSKENLCETLLEIQNYMIGYADAFYWLRYKSFLTASSPLLNISIVDNGNDAADAIIAGNFFTQSFFEGADGIYFNATSADPDGLSEEIITIEPGQSDVTSTLVAVTFSRNGSDPSQYEWASGDESVVTVAPDAKNSAIGIISVVSPGTTQLTVTDTANNIQQTINVTVQLKGPSYQFTAYTVQSASPWFADATFQVRETESENNQWTWVTDLLREDFQVLENGALVDLDKSEINLRKRDAIPSNYSYTLKTILLIDNTPSIGTENLDLMKDAAKAFVARALENNPKDNTDFGPLLDINEMNQQQIAIWTFTEEGDSTIWLDFTSDKNDIDEAIEEIPAGYGPTDFYGGMIDALTLADTDHFPRDGNTELQQVIVVALSDGNHSNIGFAQKSAVLAERGTRQIVTVGVGDDLVSSVSKDLVDFGNVGFYSVPDPGNNNEVTIFPDDPLKDTKKDIVLTDLEVALMNIQDNLVDFANSFYWLNYKSYVDPASDCNDREDLNVTIYDNTNVGAGSEISSSFQSCEFFDGIDGKIYLNSMATNPWGEEGPINIEYYNIAGLNITGYEPFQLEAFTYNHQNTPNYDWLSGNENIVLIDVDETSYARSRAELVLPATKVPGTTNIRVDDTVNGSFFNVNVNVSAISVPAPLVYYPFSGNLNDASGNGYDATIWFGNPKLTKNRCNEDDKAYSFVGSDSWWGQSMETPSLVYNQKGGIDEITVCAWVRSSSNRNQTLMTANRSHNWCLNLNEAGNLRWITVDPNGAVDNLNIINTYLDGQWHFICAWFKAGNGAVDKKLFVDGVNVASKNAHAGMNLGTGAESHLYIAAAVSGTNKYWLFGAIDDIMIFDQALTDEQIQILYNLNCID